MPNRRHILLGAALGSAAFAAPGVEHGARNPAQPDVDDYQLWRTPGATRLVLLLPPYGGDARYYRDSRLPAMLAQRGIDLAVLHTHATGFLEPAELQRLDALVRFLLGRYDRAPQQLALGGFSAGGYAALRYAQWALGATGPGTPAFVPRAVFSVDAPLDLTRWHAGLTRAHQQLTAHRPDSPFLGEARYVAQLLERLYGGPPSRVPEVYEERSVYSGARPDGGNARWLRTLPIRLYTEPDPEFYLAQGIDPLSSNTVDQLSLINLLRLQGHTAASIVLTQGRGVRPDLGGQRLPHAWSIVDEEELAGWLDTHMRPTSLRG